MPFSQKFYNGLSSWWYFFHEACGCIEVSGGFCQDWYKESAESSDDVQVPFIIDISLDFVFMLQNAPTDRRKSMSSSSRGSFASNLNVDLCCKVMQAYEKSDGILPKNIIEENLLVNSRREKDHHKGSNGGLRCHNCEKLFSFVAKI
ncbi:hypothetical protein SUGI_0695410 [Cryptomeria japonica]|nr:hypothetical protein SUGI_0695410 [Cryptomeria japonica]